MFELHCAEWYMGTLTPEGWIHFSSAEGGGVGLCAVLESRYHIYGHLKPSVYKEQLVLIFSPVKWIFFA